MYVTEEAKHAQLVQVILNDGDYLELRGGNDWGRTEYPQYASTFRSVDHALETIESLGVFSARRIEAIV